MQFDSSEKAIENESSHDGDCIRRVYTTPRLRKVGRLYEVTLGGSAGTGDTGNPSLAKVPSGGKRGNSPHLPHP